MKVVVGMSGGVDSSIAAYLLKKEGYEVIGVTMQLWDCGDNAEGNCGGNTAAQDAKAVAEKLGIEHHVVSFEKEFREKVVDYFTQEYLCGHTPNPCNRCNRHLKWGALLEKAKELGADYIATGHYAKVRKLDNGRYAVANSVTAEKDQTYALCFLTQEQLSHTLMPVGEYHKSEVRQMATSLGLITAGKKDSQDICFIPDGDYSAFLEREIPAEKLPPHGNFVLEDGTVVGEHKGIIHYTIGQRRGLGIAAGERIFVRKIDVEKNEIVLGEDLHQSSLIMKDVNFMGISEFGPNETYLAKVRYAHRGELCKVTNLGGEQYRLDFAKEVRAITPGQTVALYKEDYVVAGGVIVR